MLREKLKTPSHSHTLHTTRIPSLSLASSRFDCKFFQQIHSHFDPLKWSYHTKPEDGRYQYFRSIAIECRLKLSHSPSFQQMKLCHSPFTFPLPNFFKNSKKFLSSHSPPLSHFHSLTTSPALNSIPPPLKDGGFSPFSFTFCTVWYLTIKYFPKSKYRLLRYYWVFSGFAIECRLSVQLQKNHLVPRYWTISVSKYENHLQNIEKICYNKILHNLLNVWYQGTRCKRRCVSILTHTVPWYRSSILQTTRNLFGTLVPRRFGIKVLRMLTKKSEESEGRTLSS